MKQNQDNDKLQWQLLSDIKTVRTSDPQEMLGKYIAEPVFRKWTEEYVDKSTGESCEIERQEIIIRYGTRVDKDELQAIMFHIQSGDIHDVLVCDRKVSAEMFSYSGLIPFEVTLSHDCSRKMFLVRANDVVNALNIVHNYGALYGGIDGIYTVRKVEIKTMIIVEEDDECMMVDDSDNDIGIEYFKVTVRISKYDDIDDVMKTSDYDIVLPSGDVSQAKNRAAEFSKLHFKNTLALSYHNRFNIIKAQPYTVWSVVPEEYSILFNKNKTKK